MEDYKIKTAKINKNTFNIKFTGCWNCLTDDCKNGDNTESTIKNVFSDSEMDALLLIGDNAYPKKTKIIYNEDNEKKVKYYNETLIKPTLDTLHELTKEHIKEKKWFKVFFGIGNHDIEPQYSKHNVEFYDNSVNKKKTKLVKKFKLTDNEEIDTIKDLFEILVEEEEPNYYDNYLANKNKTNKFCFPFTYIRSYIQENVIEEFSYINNYYYNIFESNTTKIMSITLDTNLLMSDKIEICDEIYTGSKDTEANIMMSWFFRKLIDVRIQNDFDYIIILGHHPIVHFKKLLFNTENYQYFKDSSFIEYINTLPEKYKDRIIYLCADTHNYQDIVIQTEKNNIRHIISGGGGADLDDIFIEPELLEHLKKTDCKLDTSENKLEALSQHTINISKTIKKEELNITVNKTYPDVNIENDIYGYCDIKFEKDKVDINFIKN